MGFRLTHRRGENKKGPNKLNTSGETALFEACEVSNAKRVKALLSKSRVDVNKPDPSGETPFHAACLGRHVEIVKLFLADPRTDVTAGNPFSLVCRSRDVPLIKLLMEDERVNVNQRDRKGATPFLRAVDLKHDEVIDALMEDPRTDINQMDLTGVNPLALACSQQREDLVKRLLADSRIELKDSLVALTESCKKGFMDMVNIFLGDERIDLNQANDMRLNRIPLVAACDAKQFEVVEELLKCERMDVTPLMAKALKVSRWYDSHPEKHDVIEDITRLAVARGALSRESITNEELRSKVSS